MFMIIKINGYGTILKNIQLCVLMNCKSFTKMLFFERNCDTFLQKPFCNSTQWKTYTGQFTSTVFSPQSRNCQMGCTRLRSESTLNKTALPVLTTRFNLIYVMLIAMVVLVLVPFPYPCPQSIAS